MIELNIRFTLITANGTISPAGIEAVQSLILSQRLTEGDWKDLNPTNGRSLLPVLPDEWQWTWVIQRGIYAGTMPKRISSYYFKAHGLKCPPAFLAALGNLARQHSNEQLTYHFDFTDRFDWQAGDFGDAGSCLWNSREAGRTIMQDNGAKAVRFYNNDGRGIGRAWLYEIQPSLLVTWGGYGFKADSTLQIARVLAQHFNLTYKKISLVNQGDDGGLVWINNGRGYLLGLPGMVAPYSYYDLEFPTPEDHCESCGRPVAEDNHYVGADDEFYCEECYYTRFEDCGYCGQVRFREDITYVQSAMSYVCDRCLDRDFDRCASCDEYFNHHDLTEYHEEVYCRNCFAELEKDDSEE